MCIQNVLADEADLAGGRVINSMLLAAMSVDEVTKEQLFLKLEWKRTEPLGTSMFWMC